MSLILTNLIYVFYRLVVSAPIVKFVNKFAPYYLAVFIMAQLSFAYDNIVFKYYFAATELPTFYEYFVSDCIYTLRVLAAWWLIKQIWNWVDNYWVAVFIGAEITFFCDYFIFNGLYQ